MKCPTCKKKIEIKDNRFRPFCSERCKLIDLGAWLDGRYVIKGDEEKEENKKRTVKRHQKKKKS